MAMVTHTSAVELLNLPLWQFDGLMRAAYRVVESQRKKA